jgi:GNAT superfamily N-acetyltransferase
VLADANNSIWVAERDGRAVGFVAVRLDEENDRGEVWMLAVDPDHQRHGIGTALTTVATEWIREAGMSVAMIDTGGDAGHAPARHVYAKSGYSAMPIARYFKAL